MSSTYVCTDVYCTSTEHRTRLIYYVIVLLNHVLHLEWNTWIMFIIHRTHNKCGGTQQNRACHWTIRRLAYYCQKKKAKMVWPCLKVFWSLKNDHAGYSPKAEGEGVARESDGKIISRIGLVYVLLNP